MKKWRCIVCGAEFEQDPPPGPCPVCGVEGDENFEEITD